jgi:hypothetical protein
MSRDPDVQLEEMFLEDQELYETANVMRSLAAPEAPLDPVFQSELRRKLMSEAWARHEKRGRRRWPSFGPAPRLTWAASLVGVFLIAFVVAAVLLNQPGGGPGAPVSSLDGRHNVAVVVPIDVNFNQPMDPAATQAAIKVEPATDLKYEWSNNNTRLTITPSSKELAPNTQYVVTVGAGAKTAAGTEVPAPKAPISFVTGGLPSPAPTPVVTPTPPAKLSNERQIAALYPGAYSLPQLGQWSPDGGTFYFIGTGSQLAATGLGGGVRTLVPAGVKMFALSPDGANLAYAASGKIFRLAADGAGSPVELTSGDPGAIAFTSPSPSPQLNPVAAGPSVVFFQNNTVYKVASPGAVTKVLSTSDAATAVQFSPAGDRLIYWTQQPVVSRVVELGSGQASDRGAGLNIPIAWSADGSRVAGADSQGVYLAAADGKNLVRVATREKLGVAADTTLDVSWAGSNQVLISTRSQLWSGALDGSGPVKVADGQFEKPLASPGATTVAFLRGPAPSLLLVDYSAPANVSAGALLEDGGRQVAAFMDFRVKGQSDQAGAFLDDSGRTAYEQTGSLILTGDPKLSRAYQVTSEATSTQPVSLRYTVRLVFSSGKLEVSQSDETLTLVKDAGGRLVVHQVVATQRRPVGKGPEVVSVKVSPTGVTVLLDSDLDAKTVPGNVVITDTSGQPVSLKYAVGYGNRTVTVTLAAGLTPGQSYRLSVLTGLKDVGGRAITGQYDFEFDGPAG